MTDSTSRQLCVSILSSTRPPRDTMNCAGSAQGPVTLAPVGRPAMARTLVAKFHVMSCDFVLALRNLYTAACALQLTAAGRSWREGLTGVRAGPVDVQLLQHGELGAVLGQRPLLHGGRCVRLLPAELREGGGRSGPRACAPSSRALHLVARRRDDDEPVRTVLLLQPHHLLRAGG
jgi:hypothetical protein